LKKKRTAIRQVRITASRKNGQAAPDAFTEKLILSEPAGKENTIPKKRAANTPNPMSNALISLLKPDR
jgi:hypothetical protein